MTRLYKLLGVLLVATLGAWGCAKAPNTPAASNDKVRNLEARNARLEEDFRAAAAARDQFRRKLGESEEAQSQLQQEVNRLQGVARERDEFQAQLKARTAERDNLQAQYEGFRKGIRDMLGQAEAALAKPADPNLASTKPAEAAPSLAAPAANPTPAPATAPAVADSNGPTLPGGF